MSDKNKPNENKSSELHPFKFIAVDVTGVVINPDSSLFLSFDLEDKLTAESIRGLGAPFYPRKNDVVYLQLDILPNLDIRSASIIYGPVGKSPEGEFPRGNIPGTPIGQRIGFPEEELEREDWPEYPSLIQYRPKNSFANRRQTKAYVLLAYMSENPSNLNESIPILDDQDLKYHYLCPTLKSDLMVTHFCDDGVPILYPTPFFNAKIKESLIALE